MRDRIVRTTTALALMFSTATARPQDDELGDLLETMPLWEQFYVLRGGFGYSDNILYSDLNQKASGSLVTGFDATLFRLPLDGSEINLFLSLDDRRYFDGGGVTNQLAGPGPTNRVDAVRGERTILGLGRYQRDFTTNFQAGIAGQYFYQDQVLDVSVTEVDLGTLPVNGHQLLVRSDGTIRGDRHQVQLEAEWQRQLFDQEELDDYTEYGPQLTWTWRPSDRATLDLDYGISRRDYDSRNEYAPDGTPLAGTRLHYVAQQLDLEWTQHLDAARRWRMRARAGLGRNDDSASGYFNFNRCSGQVQLRFLDDPWEVRVHGRLSWYQYALQTSDENPGDRRQRLVVQSGLRLDRRVGPSWRLFAEYEFEQANSNLSYDAYTVNQFAGGLEWEF